MESYPRNKRTPQLRKRFSSAVSSISPQGEDLPPPIPPEQIQSPTSLDRDSGNRLETGPTHQPLNPGITAPQRSPRTKEATAVNNTTSPVFLSGTTYLVRGSLNDTNGTVDAILHYPSGKTPTTECIPIIKVDDPLTFQEYDGKWWCISPYLISIYDIPEPIPTTTTTPATTTTTPPTTTTTPIPIAACGICCGGDANWDNKAGCIMLRSNWYAACPTDWESYDVPCAGSGDCGGGYPTLTCRCYYGQGFSLSQGGAAYCVTSIILNECDDCL